MDIKDLLYIIYGLIIVYLIYKTKNINSEHFESTNDIISNTIKTKYNDDINHIKKISSAINDILNNKDSFTINNNLNLKNTIINGNFNCLGDINFVNKNQNFINILPKYMIMAWADKISIYPDNVYKPPKGWALCDGFPYSVGSSGYAFRDYVNGIYTPDLRGRFIVGSNFDLRNSNKYKIGNIGGEEMHKLTIDEMPSHNHTADGFVRIGGEEPGLKVSSSTNTYMSDPNVDLDNTGGDQSHNNMPPYYVLNYIMKL